MINNLLKEGMWCVAFSIYNKQHHVVCADVLVMSGVVMGMTSSSAHVLLSTNHQDLEHHRPPQTLTNSLTNRERERKRERERTQRRTDEREKKMSIHFRNLNFLASTGGKHREEHHIFQGYLSCPYYFPYTVCLVDPVFRVVH